MTSIRMVGQADRRCRRPGGTHTQGGTEERRTVDNALLPQSCARGEGLVGRRVQSTRSEADRIEESQSPAQQDRLFEAEGGRAVADQGGFTWDGSMIAEVSKNCASPHRGEMKRQAKDDPGHPLGSVPLWWDAWPRKQLGRLGAASLSLRLLPRVSA